MHGPGWFTMQYSGSKPTKISINPDVSSDVYILKNASGNPNNFVHDMKILGVMGNTTFSSDDLAMTSSSGYSIAVYVNAVNEPANSLLDAKLDLFFSVGASTFGLIGAMAAIALTSV